MPKKRQEITFLDSVGTPDPEAVWEMLLPYFAQEVAKHENSPISQEQQRQVRRVYQRTKARIADAGKPKDTNNREPE